AVQLADANLAQDLRVVAHHAAGIELDLDAAARALLDLGGSGAHFPHPVRAVRRARRDLELAARRGRDHAAGADEQRGQLQNASQDVALRHQKYSFEDARSCSASSFASTLNSVNPGASTGASSTSASNRSCSSWSKTSRA